MVSIFMAFSAVLHCDDRHVTWLRCSGDAVGWEARGALLAQGRGAFRQLGSGEAEEFHAERRIEDRPGRA
jgi:hypothetical protein